MANLFQVARIKGSFSPSNPNPFAEARVKNKLPAPTACPHCGFPVEIARNRVIYGQDYGDWPWVYICTQRSCRASVGVHPQTAIPLGTLADSTLRNWRKKAKNMFNPLWEKGEMTRTEAYAWLSREMGISSDTCHFGWFSDDQCKQVISIISIRNQPKKIFNSFAKAKVLKEPK